MWKKRLKDSFVRIAEQLGFLTGDQTCGAQELIESCPEDTSQDLLVRAEMLTESQAKVVSCRLAQEDPEAHLVDRIKIANRVQDSFTTMSINASEIAAAIALKKAK